MNHTFEQYDRQKEIDKFHNKFVNGLNKADSILFNIALGDNSTYDSEYDGINDTYCRYCDANLSRGEHDSDCDIFEARDAISKIWERYNEGLAKINKKHDDIIEAKRAKEAHRKEKIECPKCHKKVSRIGMKEHQKSPACARHALKEHQKRTGLVCYSDPNMNYEGKRCKQCGKPMPDAHPNAVFCSNKGKGNCKDKYHNRQPGRIEQSRKFAPKKPADPIDVAHAIVIARRLHGEGWDEHKDY